MSHSRLRPISRHRACLRCLLPLRSGQRFRAFQALTWANYHSQYPATRRISTASSRFILIPSCEHPFSTTRSRSLITRVTP